jgi:hypothetical protein
MVRVTVCHEEDRTTGAPESSTEDDNVGLAGTEEENERWMFAGGDESSGPELLNCIFTGFGHDRTPQCHPLTASHCSIRSWRLPPQDRAPNDSINSSRWRNKLTHPQHLDSNNAQTRHDTRTHTCPEHLHGTRTRQERSLDVFIPADLEHGGKLTVRRTATPKLPHLYLCTHRYVQLYGTYTKPSYHASQSNKQEPSTGHWELCKLTASSSFVIAICVLSIFFFDCHRKATTLLPEIPP